LRQLFPAAEMKLDLLMIARGAMAQLDDQKTKSCSNGFLLTPEKLDDILVSVNFTNVQRIEIVDNGSRSIPQIIRTLRAAFGTTQAPRHIAITIKTTWLSVTELNQLSAASNPGKSAPLRSTGVGIWQIPVGHGQHITLVQTQLRKAWRRLKFDPAIDLDAVTGAICSQTDSLTLTELFLQRAMLALPLCGPKPESAQARRQSWQEMTAVEFVKPYAACGGLGDLKGVSYDVRSLYSGKDEVALSQVNRVLLRVVQPVY